MKKKDQGFSVLLLCPCCGRQRHSIKNTILLSITENVAPWYYDDPSGWAIIAARDDSVDRPMQWACNDCLKKKYAFQGDPGAQLYCDYPPYLAYFDRIYSCKDCGENFVFGAREQQYFYEQLRFWVQYHPTRCRQCRYHRRAKKKAAQELSRFYAQFDPQNVEQLLSMVSCFLLVGSVKKADEFARRARNQAHRQGRLDEFQQRIDVLMDQIRQVL